jgi:hypothetical protein
MNPNIMPLGMMKQTMNMLMTAAISTELLYSFVIIICSLMVYFGTKELYELSSHKGIKYFRQSFLFFALAYFFRSSIIFLVSIFQKSMILDLSPRFFGILTLLIFMYTSTMAVFCLLYSVIWKRFNNEKSIYLFHIAAIALSIMTGFIREMQVLLGLQIILFVFVIIFEYAAHKNSSNKKKGKSLYLIYILLFAFWTLNVIDILAPRSLGNSKLMLYLLSIGIFLTILYKVLKRSGSN